MRAVFLAPFGERRSQTVRPRSSSSRREVPSRYGEASVTGVRSLLHIVHRPRALLPSRAPVRSSVSQLTQPLAAIRAMETPQLEYHRPQPYDKHRAPSSEGIRGKMAPPRSPLHLPTGIHGSSSGPQVLLSTEEPRFQHLHTELHSLQHSQKVQQSQIRQLEKEKAALIAALVGGGGDDDDPPPGFVHPNPTLRGESSHAEDGDGRRRIDQWLSDVRVSPREE